MDRSIRGLVLVLLLFGVVRGGRAQVSPQADLLLNETEAHLRELVKQVESNANISCDVLSRTCNEESTCSRLSCPLTTTRTAGYGCQGVLQNTNCEGNCSRRNFDFSQSFLRIPGVLAATDYIDARQLREICAQRNLDTSFQPLSNNTNFFRLYFGSASGVFRIFPGMDERECGRYEPRFRSGYLAATADVKKGVMVLIDSGSTMTDTVRSTSNDSNLQTAFRATKAFLNTTFNDDLVNIFTFNQASVDPFSNDPVRVTDSNSHPDFGNFTAKLSAPNPISTPTGNISDAITKVILSTAGFGSSDIPNEYLKVIILITDSTAVNDIGEASLPWDLIKSNSISVFLYMFPPSTAAIASSSLASQLCEARGSFEVLDETVSRNPLRSFNTYYSFVANIFSTYVNPGIAYTTEYQDFSQVDNRTFTLSKSVFSSAGRLLGVAAIDIFKTKLLEVYKIDGDTIEEAVRKRANRNKDFNASAITTKSCLVQATDETCNTAALNASNIVCSSTFDADITEMKELSCCGVCAASDSPGGLTTGAKAGVGVAVPVGVGVIVIVLACWWCGWLSPCALCEKCRKGSRRKKISGASSLAPTLAPAANRGDDDGGGVLIKGEDVDEVPVRIKGGTSRG